MTRLACSGSLPRTLVRGLLAACLFGAAACSGDTGDRCEKNSDCSSGLICIKSTTTDGTCQPEQHGVDAAPTDTGADLMSIDAVADAEQDAGTDQ